MKIACLGGGPAGLYFAISMKLRDAAHDITVFERNRPDDTFGWGVVLSDETLDNLAANDPVSAEAIRAPFRLLGRHRGALSRPADRLDRPRLFRHRAQEAAAAAAAARARARRRAAVPDRGRQRRGAREDLRSRRRRRRPEFQDPRRIRRAFQARHRDCARTSSSGSAPTRNSTTPSPSSSKRPSTAGSGRTPISSMPTPRPSSSNARRRPGRNSASAR